MTAQPIKKKRYEGLIQFQDPLRQAMVCLQAALAERFTTGAQMDFLKAKDGAQTSHFLLTSNGSAVGDNLTRLENHHLLLRIEQLADMTMPQRWSPDAETKIAAWLDSKDPLAAQYIFQLLAQAGSGQHHFDLASGSAFAGATFAWQKTKKAPNNSAWSTPERDELLASFQGDAKSLFKKIEKQDVASDGCTVAFIIEGTTALSWHELSAKAFVQLAKPDRHLVSVNFMSGTPNRLQCLYVAPMRLPLKHLQSSSLKAFLLIRDIKEAAKDIKAVIAS